jgi:hypothetical protein
MDIKEVLYCLIILTMVISHRIERKDLYNRIMSRDIKEYKSEPIKAQDRKSRADESIKKWQNKEVM